MMEIEQIHETLSKHGYDYEKILGKGSFSSVILCKSRKYNQNFAIKRIIKKEGTQVEYNTMISLNHPNIIKLYDTFEDETAQYLVMEYCSNGTLKQQGKLSDDKFIQYARQILNAISYCHLHKVAHRDIKPDNIFLDHYDQIKLGDFGLSKHFDDDSRSTERCGSLMFFAPEMMKNKSVCPFKADIWALGITFFFMATGNYPYRSNSKDELKKMIYFGQLDFDNYDIDQDIRHLIDKMANKNIKSRLSPEELLKLPIFPQKKLCKPSMRQSFIYKAGDIFEISKICKNEKENVRPKLMLKMNSFRIIENHPKTQRNNNRIQHLTF